MMDSPSQRILRFTNDLGVMFLVVSIFTAYVDGGLASLLVKMGILSLMHRAATALGKKNLPPSSSISQHMDSSTSFDRDEFLGAELVSPIRHHTASLRWYRAISLLTIPLFMHAFVFFGPPLTNYELPASVAGGVLSEFEYRRVRDAVFDAGDVPAAILNAQNMMQTTKFWSFLAAPELGTKTMLLGLDVLSIVILYAMLTSMVVAAGGSMTAIDLMHFVPQGCPVQSSARVERSHAHTDPQTREE